MPHHPSNKIRGNSRWLQTELCAGLEVGAGAIHALHSAIKTQQNENEFNIFKNYEPTTLGNSSPMFTPPNPSPSQPSTNIPNPHPDQTEKNTTTLPTFLPFLSSFPPYGPKFPTLFDAKNGFNELFCLQMLYTIRHLWPSASRFIFNC